MIRTRNSVTALAPVLLLALLAGANAQAQERKAYKVVDANGSVTYTQTPPVAAKDAKKVEKVDIAPAQRGRGGYSGGYGSHHETRYYSNQPSHDRNDRYAAAAQSRDQRAADRQADRQAELRAECERQRGTDCNNPRALQYLDSTSIPRRGRY
jgi:hypothetical protein